MRISLLYLVLLLGMFVARSYAQVFADPETRGVWAPAGYSPSDSAGIDTLVRNLSSANFNIIYVGVWDGHSTEAGTIYPSSVVKDAGGPMQYPDYVGRDPLRTYIDIAHKYGMEVFAWFELMPFDVSVGSTATDIPTLLKAHTDWSMLQRDTTTNYHHNIYGYYFGIDPGVPAACNFVVRLYTEIAKNYPDLDGIESDIEDDTLFSYSDIARARFVRETGNPDPLTLPGNDPAWLAWRRRQITNVVKRIYNDVKRVNPECVVSGAVPPPYMSSYMLESWGDWAKRGYVDMLEPMLYVNTSDFDHQMELCEDYVPKGFHLSPGIAISSAGSAAKTVYEIQDAINRDAAGVTIWYYNYLLSYPNALADLKSEAFPEKALPGYDDLIMDNVRIGMFRSTGSWTTQRGGYDGTYLSARAVKGDTAVFSVRVLRSGNYTLYGYWGGDSSANCSKATVRVTMTGLTKSYIVNEGTNTDSWSSLDEFHLDSDDTITVKLFGADGKVLVADAFRLRRESPTFLGDCALPDSDMPATKSVSHPPGISFYGSTYLLAERGARLLDVPLNKPPAGEYYRNK